MPFFLPLLTLFFFRCGQAVPGWLQLYFSGLRGTQGVGPVLICPTPPSTNPQVLQHFEEQISSRIVSSEEQDFSIADILRLLAEGLEGWKGDGLKVCAGHCGGVSCALGQESIPPPRGTYH